MGKFDISPEQEEELKSADSTTPVTLPGASGQVKRTYHNPATGQEIRSLGDPYHMMIRLQEGWQLGSASPGLKEKWAIREAELRAEDDRMEAEHIASSEHVDAERTRFNDAVKEATALAVAAILEKQGATLPDAGVMTEESAPAPEGKQLAFDLPADAPSETETKHVVSEASSPALHLVGHREE